MEPEERQEVTQLLEFGEHTAAGRMTTEFIAVPRNRGRRRRDRGAEGSSKAAAKRWRRSTSPAPAQQAGRRGAARQDRHLVAGRRSCRELSEPYIACAPDTPQDEVAALFDKYNLLTLAVVDEHGRLAGIITADDVITMLRHRD